MLKKNKINRSAITGKIVTKKYAAKHKRTTVTESIGKPILHKELEKAARPLIKYLCENYNPHVIAIVTPTGVELLEGLRSIEVKDYVRG